MIIDYIVRVEWKKGEDMRSIGLSLGIGYLDGVEPDFTVHVINQRYQGRDAFTIQCCVFALCGDGDAVKDK